MRKNIKRNISMKNDYPDFYEKIIEIKYPISDSITGTVKDEYYRNRELRGVSGLINVIDSEIRGDKKEGSILVLNLILRTNEAVTDREAPIIADSIIEKYDDKRKLGRASQLKVRAS